jgi:hypothetical protein
MWWNKKRAIEQKEKETLIIDLTTERINELRAFRDIGDTFNYLGRTIIVTGHSTIMSSQFFFSRFPMLLGDYVDNEGIIRQVKFDYAELSGIKKQN